MMLDVFMEPSLSACPLCNHAEEDAFYFIAVSMQLHFARLAFLPPCVLHAFSGCQIFYDVVLGIRLIPGLSVKVFLIYSISLGAAFLKARNVISSSPVGKSSWVLSWEGLPVACCLLVTLMHILIIFHELTGPRSEPFVLGLFPIHRAHF